ncbi:hypothetical protein IPZ70_22095 [Streptomyces polychromogenes]|nr:hypothetical protein [Streptomyces polychromogenes]
MVKRAVVGVAAGAVLCLLGGGVALAGTVQAGTARPAGQPAPVYTPKPAGPRAYPTAPAGPEAAPRPQVTQDSVIRAGGWFDKPEPGVL